MPELADLMTELTSARRPFVRATVVRAQEPTSARPGDAAIILDDGSMAGFVGGQCAQASVRTAALDTLRDGNTLLLRVLPGGDADFPESPGARVVVNPCYSGGAVEVFLQPMLPPPVLHLVGGDTPIGEAVATLAGFLGFAVERGDGSGGGSGSGELTQAVAVVVASLGRDEEQPAIRAALAAGVGFVGLVASPRRGAAMLDGMGLTDAERARVHTPLGLDIGARTPAEIALSVLAELVRAIRLDGLSAPAAVAVATAPPSEPDPVVDPVCGMTVVVGPDTPHLHLAGQDHWFCCPGCRDRFAAQQTG